MNHWADATTWIASRLAWSLRRRGVAGTAARAALQIARWAGMSEPKRDAAAAYRWWLKREGSDCRACAQARVMLERLPSRPLVTLVATVRERDDLKPTLASLRAQAYPNWELVVAGEPRAIAASGVVADGRIRLESVAGTRRSHLGRALASALGELVAIVDPGDELAPQALAEVVAFCVANPGVSLVYTDEDLVDDAGRRSAPRFKPDWSPDLFDALDYVGRLAVVRREAIDAAGALGGAPEGAEEYDLLLRVTEHGKVGHVARVLYHARGVRSLDEAAASLALQRALERRGSSGTVVPALPGVRRVLHGVKGVPLVSLIVPTRGQGDLLRNLLESVDERSSYRRFEVLVVDNGSTDRATLRYLSELECRWRVLRDGRPFNWAALNNAAAREAKGEFLVFLNNDVEVVAEGWLEAMLALAQRPEVGAVGARLLYPDRTIQHAGVIVGLGGLAAHAFKDLPSDTAEPLGGPSVPRNWSAVTGACMMVRRDVFEALHGFDERLGVAYNDVDYCLRARAAGYLVVYTPWATLLHFESATRRRIDPRRDRVLFQRRWREVLEACDPYYNPNLSLERGDWRPGRRAARALSAIGSVATRRPSSGAGARRAGNG